MEKYFAYMAFQCPSKTSLHIGKEEAEELKQPGEDINNDHNENPEYNADDLEDSDIDTSFAMVVRHTVTALKLENQDWRRTTIFQTLVTCGKELLKLVINGASCMNVVSASSVERLKLPIQPHPQPDHVAWMITLPYL